MTQDDLTPQLLREALTNDELVAAVIAVAEEVPGSDWYRAAWDLYVSDEHTRADALIAWRALVHAVAERDPRRIDDAAMWLVHRVTPETACRKCVQRKRGLIHERHSHRTSLCMLHLIESIESHADMAVTA